MFKAAVAGLLVLLFLPAILLVVMTTLLHPAAQANCLPSVHGTGSPDTVAVPETARVVFPLPAGTWVRTSGYGVRVHPITGERTVHTGVDFAADPGTPILAAADGRVVLAAPATGYGHWILIEHTVDGERVATGYAHMYASGIHVTAGENVTAGQHIADVGSDGYSTGDHLHFEVFPGGAESASADPEPWLATHGAATAAVDADPTAGCASPAADPADPFPDDTPDGMVDDPTSDGQITTRTAHVLAQVRARFPDSAWACWSPRSGPSEHPLGRACDGTFGNVIGVRATGPALRLGWQVTNWLKANADALGVDYLIWQGRIWSLARQAEGWRAYNGGGMHDPGDVTGGHYDHMHVTVTSN